MCGPTPWGDPFRPAAAPLAAWLPVAPCIPRAAANFNLATRQLARTNVRLTWTIVQRTRTTRKPTRPIIRTSRTLGQPMRLMRPATRPIYGRRAAAASACVALLRDIQ